MPALTRTDYEAERDLFRQGAVEGLDEAFRDFAARRFTRTPTDTIQGARDHLLPALFREADRCFDDALNRYGLTVEA